MKRKLRLDELAVVSFATEDETPARERGTVRAHAPGSEVPTCGVSCEIIRTCANTCQATCPITCSVTCYITCVGCF